MEKVENPYISPDDGLPDKRLKDIFDRSNAYGDETQLQDVTESEQVI